MAVQAVPFLPLRLPLVRLPAIGAIVAAPHERVPLLDRQFVHVALAVVFSLFHGYVILHCGSCCRLGWRLSGALLPFVSQPRIPAFARKADFIIILLSFFASFILFRLFVLLLTLISFRRGFLSGTRVDYTNNAVFISRRPPPHALRREPPHPPSSLLS